MGDHKLGLVVVGHEKGDNHINQEQKIKEIFDNLAVKRLFLHKTEFEGKHNRDIDNNESVDDIPGLIELAIRVNEQPGLPGGLEVGQVLILEVPLIRQLVVRVRVRFRENVV